MRSPRLRRSAVTRFESAISATTDPRGLASTANVDFANFANAPLKVDGVSINEADAAAQPVRTAPSRELSMCQL